MQTWLIAFFRKDGTLGSVMVEHPKEPSYPDAAIAIRNLDEGREYLLGDTLRGADRYEIAKAFFDANGITKVTISPVGGIEPYSDY